MHLTREMTEKHHIAFVFVLLAFCIFAVCILLVLLTGANSYRSLTRRDTETYSRSICVRYIAAKVRHADTAGSIEVGRFSTPSGECGGTLFLAEENEGKLYYTRIYCYQGYVRELYAAASESFEPLDGEPVLKAQNLWFQLNREDGLLTIRSRDEQGRKESLTLSLRSSKGEDA